MPVVLQYLLGFLVFAIVITVVVSIHEGGHFYFAKKAGILCREFSIGMGPLIYQKKKGETVYSLRLIPLGGYVSMAGEEIEDDLLAGIHQVRVHLNKDGRVDKLILNLDNPKYKDLPLFDLIKYELKGTLKKDRNELYVVLKLATTIKKRKKDPTTKKAILEEEPLEQSEEFKQKLVGEITYYCERNLMINYAANEEIQLAPVDRDMNHASCGKRAMTIFAGPMMNFVLAFFIFLIMGIFWGYPKTNSTIVEKISEDSPVYLEGAGLQKNDRITHINVTGKNDSSSYDFQDVTKWDDISAIMNKAALGQDFTGQVEITYLRDGTSSTITVTPIVVIYAMEMVIDEAGVKDLKPIVGDYGVNMEKTKAYAGGLRAGDLITEIDYDNDSVDRLIEIHDLNDLLIVLNSDELAKSRELSIKYERTEDGSTTTGVAKVTTYSREMLDTQSIPMTKVQVGISPIEGFDLGKLLYMPFVNIGKSSVQVLSTLKLLFTDKSVKVTSLSGPIGIFNLFATLVGGKDALYNILYWTALISVNLGLFNLFPIPALDGSKLVEVAYEAITKKKANAKVMNIIYTIGFILLIGLFIIVAVSDVFRLFGKSI